MPVSGNFSMAFCSHMRVDNNDFFWSLILCVGPKFLALHITSGVHAISRSTHQLFCHHEMIIWFNTSSLAKTLITTEPDILRSI